MQKQTVKQTDNQYAPPVRSEKKIGNTTFIIHSYFPVAEKESVASKVERLIKDDIRKSAVMT